MVITDFFGVIFNRNDATDATLTLPVLHRELCFNFLKHMPSLRPSRRRGNKNVKESEELKFNFWPDTN